MKLGNFEKTPSIISNDWPTYSIWATENLIKPRSLYLISMLPTLVLQSLSYTSTADTRYSQTVRSF